MALVINSILVLLISVLLFVSLSLFLLLHKELIRRLMALIFKLPIIFKNLSWESSTMGSTGDRDLVRHEEIFTRMWVIIIQIRALRITLFLSIGSFKTSLRAISLVLSNRYYHLLFILGRVFVSVDVKTGADKAIPGWILSFGSRNRLIIFARVV